MKKTILVLLFFMFEYTLYAQDEAPIYQDKRVIYAKNQNGKNINLSLLIYNTDKQRLSINLYSQSQQKYIDTILTIHKFEYYPVETLITGLLIHHQIGTSLLKASEILEYQSLSTLGMMILTGQTFLTSYNGANQKNIKAAFRFKVKVPIYIKADSSKIQNLYKVLGIQKSKTIYTDEKFNEEKIILEKEIKNLSSLPKSKKLDSLNLELIKIDIKLITKKYQELQDLKDSASFPERYQQLYNNITVSINKLKSNTLPEAKQQIAILNDMILDYPLKKYLVGFIFVEETKCFLDNGFFKGLNIILADSLELRYRFGGYKIPISKLGIKKIIGYNLSIDIRNVKNYQKKIEKYSYKLGEHSGSNLEYWINLSDIYSYIPPENENITELFVPKKHQLIFRSKENKSSYIEEISFNNILKLNIFTDLVGIQENQPNGLVQIEGTYHAPLFGWQGSGRERFKNTIWYWLDHIEVNLKLSKIENKLRFLDASIIRGNKDVTFVPNFQLLQYSNLETGFKPSILKLESFKMDFNLYGHLGIIRTGIRDTIFQIAPNDTTKIPRTFNILSFRKSIQAHLKVRATSYTGIDIATEFIWLKLLDSDVKQSGGNFSKQQNTLQEFSSKRHVIFNPQFQVYYLPNKDESQRIYLRGAFFHDLATRSNNYLTIQVGLSSDINKFLNFK